MPLLGSATSTSGPTISSQAARSVRPLLLLSKLMRGDVRLWMHATTAGQGSCTRVMRMVFLHPSWNSVSSWDRFLHCSSSSSASGGSTFWSGNMITTGGGSCVSTLLLRFTAALIVTGRPSSS